MTLLFTLNACNKDKSIVIQENTETRGVLDNSQFAFSYLNPSKLMDWSDGTYLVFNDSADFVQTYLSLKEQYSQELSTKSDTSDNNEISSIKELFFPSSSEILDSFENSHNFFSMRKWYEDYENMMLYNGYPPEDLLGRYVMDNVLSTLISPAGLVQIGARIYYYNGKNKISAPISDKMDLKQRLFSTNKFVSFNPSFKIRGASLRGSCKADFDFTLNYNTNTVYLTYTGVDFENDPHKHIKWDIEGSSDNYKNQKTVQHQFDSKGTYDICVYYEEKRLVEKEIVYFKLVEVKKIENDTFINGDTTTVIIEVPKYEEVIVTTMVPEVICSDYECVTIDFYDCTVDFNYTIGLDNVVQFVDQSSVPYGDITKWEWQMGDGTVLTDQNPTYQYECNRDYEVTLIISSEGCLNGSQSITKTIEAKGFVCCDANSQSDWKFALNPSNHNKKIRYRYDLGSNWLGDGDDWNQNLKAKIKYYEYHKKKFLWMEWWAWDKTKGMLDVDFNGSIYGNDEDGCQCQLPKDVAAQPLQKFAKDHTFKDNLGGGFLWQNDDKSLRIKQEDPIFITYKVDGVTYVTQNTSQSPGYSCEQGG